MDQITSGILGFIVVIGFLIFVHEAGHFLMAKAFGVRVLVFSFGFGKRLFGFHKGDTDYRVSLIPLGGYVRMAGDTPEENQPGNPDEFLSKPKWQRFLILAAGPVMNLIIALLFPVILNMVGREQPILTATIGEVTPGKAAAKAGLQFGDRIVAIDGEPIHSFDDMRLGISMHAGTPILVQYERKGVLNATTMTPMREDTEYGPVGRAGISPFVEPVVGRVIPNSAASRAGLRTGDRVIEANGKPVQQLSDVAKAFDQAKGKPLSLVVQRGQQQIRTRLAPARPDEDENYPGFTAPLEFHRLAFGDAVKESISQNRKMVGGVGAALRRLVRGEASMKEFSGPVGIAKLSGEMLRSSWMDVMSLMALISLQLGIMNLLPIPVLDGGHIMILLVEGAARRDLSMRVKERVQQVGVALLFMLMIVVIYNDVITHVLMRKG